MYERISAFQGGFCSIHLAGFGLVTASP